MAKWKEGMYIPGSYSRISDYDKCPRAFREKNLTKRAPFQTSAAMERGKLMHEILAAAVHDPTVNVPTEFDYANKALIEIQEADDKRVEMDMAFNPEKKVVGWLAADVHFRSKLDVLIKKGTHYKIIDWKSGKLRLDSQQLRFYGAAVFAMSPKAKTVDAEFVFVDARQEISATFNREEHFDQLWAEIDGSLETINKDFTWIAKPSPLCRWCPVLPEHCEHRL